MLTGLDTVELGVGKAEALGDLREELSLLRVKRIVRLGDVEETFEHVLEQLAVALEHETSCSAQAS